MVRATAMGSGDERAEAANAALLDLRAHQLVVHLLGQKQFGTDPLCSTIDDALDDSEPADVFARALGVIATLLGEDAAGEIVERARQAIPGLLLRAEDRAT